MCLIIIAQFIIYKIHIFFFQIRDGTLQAYDFRILFQGKACIFLKFTVDIVLAVLHIVRDLRHFDTALLMQDLMQGIGYKWIGTATDHSFYDGSGEGYHIR